MPKGQVKKKGQKLASVVVLWKTGIHKTKGKVMMSVLLLRRIVFFFFSFSVKTEIS